MVMMMKTATTVMLMMTTTTMAMMKIVKIAMVNLVLKTTLMLIIMIKIYNDCFCNDLLKTAKVNAARQAGAELSSILSFFFILIKMERIERNNNKQIDQHE